MRRKAVFFVICVCFTVFLSCRGKSTQGQSSEVKTTLWKMGQTSTPESVPVSTTYRHGLRHPFYQFMEFIDDELADKTNDKYRIEFYIGGQLGSEADMIEGISLGTYKAGIIITSYLANYVEFFNALEFPFLYDDYDHFFRVLKSDFIADMCAKVEEDSNLVCLGLGVVGAYHLSNSKRPILTVGDVTGLKFRVMDSLVHVKTIEALGGQGIPAGWSEVYTGMQQGTFDGTTSLPWGYYSAKLYEVNQYLTENYMFYVPHAVLINKEYFYSLPEQDQREIRTAVKAAIDKHLADYVAQDEYAFEKLSQGGMKITRAGEFDRQPFVDALKPYIDANRDK
jgi:TRAP-type C4-dicarboxylate transport system substrate-binding protein